MTEDAPAAPVPLITGLSPSRAGDFMQCPLLYRFRVVDRLPERPSAAMVKGTVVHAVLERLFDLPAVERTPERAVELLGPEWERIRGADPVHAELFSGAEEEAKWLLEARALLERYFGMEDPRRLEPRQRELYVQADLPGGPRIRGYIDRLDVAPTGEVRVVDYKTGRSPRREFESSALFQMRFYALVLWRLHGEVPRLLQLMYLGDGEVLRYSPDEADLLATERKVRALWQAIRQAAASGDWRPRRSRLCSWCEHQAHCPEFGGSPPPLPDAVLLPLEEKHPA